MIHSNQELSVAISKAVQILVGNRKSEDRLLAGKAINLGVLERLQRISFIRGVLHIALHEVAPALLYGVLR